MAPGLRSGSRRIFAPQFKLQVLDSYRKDADCRGNQRATARKYGIHRRQIQKWLQVEASLRATVPTLNHDSTRQRDDTAVEPQKAVRVSLFPSVQVEEEEISEDDEPLDFTCATLSKRRSFSLQFKLEVLDAFHSDKSCHGNQRATARKFGINRRQVQKWLGQELELRGEAAFRGGLYRQRLGKSEEDKRSHLEAEEDKQGKTGSIELDMGNRSEPVKSVDNEAQPEKIECPLQWWNPGRNAVAEGRLCHLVEFKKDTDKKTHCWWIPEKVEQKIDQFDELEKHEALTDIEAESTQQWWDIQRLKHGEPDRVNRFLNKVETDERLGRWCDQEQCWDLSSRKRRAEPLTEVPPIKIPCVDSNDVQEAALCLVKVERRCVTPPPMPSLLPPYPIPMVAFVPPPPSLHLNMVDLYRGLMGECKTSRYELDCYHRHMFT